MGELILAYEERVRAADNRSYAVEAHGERQGHVWQGWLELMPADGSEVLRSARETTRPNREALSYRASGLGPIYLEGASHQAQPSGPTPWSGARAAGLVVSPST